MNILNESGLHQTDNPIHVILSSMVFDVILYYDTFF